MSLYEYILTFIAIDAYIKKEALFEIKNLTFPFQKLKNEEQTELKTSRGKEITHFRDEINEKQQRKKSREKELNLQIHLRALVILLLSAAHKPIMFCYLLRSSLTHLCFLGFRIFYFTYFVGFILRYFLSFGAKQYFNNFNF